MSDYRIAIPSYRRAKTLRSKTLSLLTNSNIDPSRIDIFVGDEDDAALYKRTLPGTWYERIIVGVPGMGPIRNFINDHYPEGQQVLNVDDDIKSIVRRIDDKTLEPVEDLDGLIKTGFRLAEQSGLRLWGIYPVGNPYFMKRRARFDLTYIVGAFWGTTIGRGDECYVTLEDKEDYERTLRYYSVDGGVVRIEDVALVTNYYGEEGGMQHDGNRTPERIEASALMLVERFPDLCSLNTSKKSGHAEIRLKDRR